MFSSASMITGSRNSFDSSPSNPNTLTNIGKFLNDVTGVSAQQNWQKEMRDTSILSQAAQYEQLGLNPSLLYGSGASAASTPGSASGSARLSIDGLLNSAANIMNASTHHYAVDRKNRHLDWQEKDTIDRTVIEIFDKLGNLVRSSAATRTFSKH